MPRFFNQEFEDKIWLSMKKSNVINVKPSAAFTTAFAVIYGLTFGIAVRDMLRWTFLSLVFIYLVQWVILYCEMFKKHMEVWYFVLFTVSTVINTIIITFWMYTVEDMVVQQLGKSLIFQMQLISQSLAYTFLCLKLATMTRFSCYFHIFHTLNAVYIILADRFLCYLCLIDSRGIVIELIEFVFLQIPNVALFVARYISEINHRYVLYVNEMNKLILEKSKLIREEKKTKQKFGYEEVLYQIRKALALMQGVAIVSKIPEAVEAADELNKCVLILQQTDKLFDVVDSKQNEIVHEFGEFMKGGGAKGFTGGPSSKVTEGKSTKIGSFKSRRATDQQSQLTMRSIKTSSVNTYIGNVWNFNLTKVEGDRGVLVETGIVLLKQANAPEANIINFLNDLQDRYLHNPYHNKLHAANVSHYFATLVKMFQLDDVNLMSPEMLTACIAAALGHDLGHAGCTNAFLVNTKHPLAIAFNDQSVLENYHAYQTVYLLEKENNELFANLLKHEYKSIKSLIIELILATDMKQHFDILSNIKIRQSSDDFMHSNNKEDFLLCLKSCLKIADLGHTCVDWSFHLEYSLKVGAEFYLQGDKELEMGLPISPLCDRTQHYAFPKSQKGFMEFVVQPFIEVVSETFLNEQFDREVKERMLSNLENWKVLADLGDEIGVVSTANTNTMEEGDAKQVQLYQANVDKLNMFLYNAVKQTKSTQTKAL